MTAEDLLIEPVQRLPRYSLLLMGMSSVTCALIFLALAKYTPEEHTDYANIQKANQEFRKLASSVNDSRKAEESQLFMFDLQKTVENFPVR
jgi:hypothetical protein